MPAVKFFSNHSGTLTSGFCRGGGLSRARIYTLRKDSHSAQPAKIRVAGETFANGPILITFVPSFENELLSLPPPPPPNLDRTQELAR